MIAATPVSAAFTDNSRTHALIDGSVRPANIELDVRAMTPGDLFYRQLKFAEFDVSELSMSSYAIALAQGDETWIGLPVFTTREFFHTGVLVRADSAIHDPRDLRHKRVGVLEYQQTSVVWIRGIFASEFGVAARDLEWYMERRPENSHGGATGFTPPDGIRLHYVDAKSSLAELLMNGEIDAILFYPALGDAIDAKPAGHRTALRTRTLFADPAAEAARYEAATGVVPINHGVVVRRSLVQRRPELGAELYRALVAARDASGASGDFPYGIAANRNTLETLTAYLYDQQLTSRRLTLRELFLDVDESGQR